MPRGLSRCPICQGKGKITEDVNVYDFVTRDPITETCLICNGAGTINYQKLLPDGRNVIDLIKQKEAAHAAGEFTGKKRGRKPGGGNGSSKRAINPESGKCADGQYELRVSCSKSAFTELWKAIFMVISAGEQVAVDIQHRGAEAQRSE